ncbi:hypothetical protein ACI8AK_05060 [Geodermatophilus sp. SYSU D00867]
MEMLWCGGSMDVAPGQTETTDIGEATGSTLLVVEGGSITTVDLAMTVHLDEAASSEVGDPGACGIPFQPAG